VTDVRHCNACATEYVAAVRVCAECGAALEAGPYVAPEPSSREDRGPKVLREEPPDRLLVRLPGLQAEFAAQALNLEGIPCTLECEGLRQVRRPGEGPGDPFAVTLPVSVYVPGSAFGTAREVLQSLAADDLIGEQWSGDDPMADVGPSAENAPSFAEPIRPLDLDPAPEIPSSGMEGTGLRLLLVLAAATALALLYAW
jgi:hypothetical protein